MAKQTIGIGSAANDGTGDTLRAAFDICNDNFTELYDGSGGLLHKIEGTNFTGSLLIGHSTTGTLDNAFYNTALGIGALDALTTGDTNVAIGYNAGTSINSGETNVVIGAYSGDALTTGDRNVAIGYQALSAEDTGHRSVAIGYNALSVQNYGDNNYNVAIGYNAGLSVTSGLQNTIIGALAADALNSGTGNVAVGWASLSSETSGNRNTAVGWKTLQQLNNTGTAYNTALGYEAGLNVSTGTQNVMLGGLAGDAVTSGSNNIIIGYDATASAVDVSNEVTIGNSSIANVRIPSDSTLKIGASGDLQLEHLSSNSFIKNTAVGDLYIENQVDDGDVIFRSDDGSGGVETYFYLDGGGGGSQPFTVWPDSAVAVFGNGHDFRFEHNGTLSKIDNYTGNLEITNYTDDGDLSLRCDDGSGGSATYMFLDGGNTRVQFNKDARFVDDKKVMLGTGDDLQIYHDGSHSYIEDTGTGQLRLKSNSEIQFLSDTNDFHAKMVKDGAVELYYDNSKKFETTNSGVTVTGDINLGDSSYLYIGASNDLQLYHDGTDSYVSNTQNEGDLIIQNGGNDKDVIFKCDDGSGGLATYFFLDGSNSHTNFQLNARWVDNSKAQFGNSGDLQIHHDSSNSYISNSTGDLYIQQHKDDGDIVFQSDDGSGGITEYFKLDGGISSMVANVDLLMALDGNGGKIKFGASQDLEIFHDGSDNFYNGTTGDMYFINKADDKDIIFQTDNGSGGYTTYFTVDGGNEVTSFQKHTKHEDSVVAYFGNASDLQIFHNSTDSFIDNYTGNLTIRNRTDDGDIVFTCDDGSGGLTTYMTLDGSDVSTSIQTIKVLMPNLPTSDPSVAGQLYTDSGVLKVSAG